MCQTTSSPTHVFSGYIIHVLNTTVFSKGTGGFSTKTVSPLVEDGMALVTVTFVKTSKRIIAELGFELTTAGFDSPRRYRLKYRGSVNIMRTGDAAHGRLVLQCQLKRMPSQTGA